MVLPNRKLPRLQSFDYSSQNYYHITVCTCGKKHLFGTIGELNVFGKIAQQELINIPSHFRGVTIDKFVIMPNHIHAIIILGCCEGAERSRPFPTLSTIIGLYPVYQKESMKSNLESNCGKNHFMMKSFAMNKVTGKYGNILTETHYNGN